jgi:hypothetical protein
VSLRSSHQTGAPSSCLLLVGCLEQPAQHPACLNNSLPSAAQWFGEVLPSQPQRRAPGLLLWVLLGLCLVAREDNHTHSGSVGSPLILPRQFLDSLELPSDEFLTLDTTQQPPVGHHRSCQMPWKAHRQCFSAATDMFYPNTALRRSLHQFTLQIGEKVDKVSTLWLKPAATSQRHQHSPGPGSAHPLSASGIFPRGASQLPAGAGVHFAPPRIEELRPGQSSRGSARPVAIPAPTWPGQHTTTGHQID